MTSRAARVLLDSIIDYAGLFPPARLSLDEAARTYARHLRAPSSWMISRFILPVSRLDEFEPHHAWIQAEGGTYELSLLAGGGVDGEEFVHALRTGLADAATFERQHDGQVRVGALELRLPDEPGDTSELTASATVVVGETLGRGVPLFLEAPAGETLEPRMAEAAHAAAGASKMSGVPVGLKIRCGGLEPDTFPSIGLVARALLGCRDLGVPFKATAGLHHPVRGAAGPGGAIMHGFLNVFGGGALAHAHGLDEGSLVTILEERDASAFRFESEYFAWRDLSIDAERLATLRRERLISFGSCSFDEPRADLVKQGFLQEASP